MATKTKKQLSKIDALAKFLECDASEITENSDNEYSHGNAEYLVLTDAEADEKAHEYIKDSLWAFNASFILGECGLDFSGEESLRAMQEKSCESANDFILSLVERTCGLDSFVESAISADGRGHFLSQYDGNEGEAVGGYFVYRTN